MRVSLAELGIKGLKGEIQQGREFALRAEQKGILQVSMPPRIRDFIGQFKAAHVYAYQLTFALMGLVALVGAIVCWLLVRKADHEVPTHIPSRRSRWMWATIGQGPGLTRKPPSERPSE